MTLSKHSTEKLTEFAKWSNNCYEFLDKIGTEHSPGSYSYWKRRLISLSIDISHWLPIQKSKKITDILTKDVQRKFRRCGKTIKKALFKAGIVDKCQRCGITKWQKQKLSLHLDHIDGDWRNNLLENLRLLCPNCHSLTDNYCGKGQKFKLKDKFCECGKKIRNTSIRCQQCYYKSKSSKPTERIKYE